MVRQISATAIITITHSAKAVNEVEQEDRETHQQQSNGKRRYRYAEAGDLYTDHNLPDTAEHRRYYFRYHFFTPF